MSTKRTRRKKPVPRKKRHLTFRLSIEAQEMLVTYKPNRMADMAQFEFRSLVKPARRIPVSETGYLCHFAPMEEVKAANSPRDFACDTVLALWQSRRKVKDDPAQCTLF